MSEIQVGGYISKIVFNNGIEVDINKNDIIVFVGPNNAGKSQALKDIYSLSEEKNSTTVVSDINIVKSTEPLISVLDSIAKRTEQNGHIMYSVLGNDFSYRLTSTEASFPRWYSYKNFRNLFVANLDTSARLNICNPPTNIRRDQAKQHPIHYAAFDGKYRKWLSDNFKKAFGIEVTPNTQYGATIPLCIGKPIKLDDQFEDEQQRLEAYAAILENYKQVQNQGDGIKSFTGILLYLMLNYYRTYLIDEPESFLHPPQARIMGQIIGNTLTDNQQAFISTHSEEILKGLLEVCPKRIKIIRITRNDDVNSFAVLSNEDIDEVWNDPLLKYSNIMSGLFHKSVVLCESDSDCKLYSIVDNYIKQVEGKYSETLFIHCGGKHRMAKIIAAMRALNIDIRLITDIDILNDETVFKRTIEAYNIEWTQIQTHYNNIVSNLHSSKEFINRNEARTLINEVLNASSNKELYSGEIKSIREAIRTTSKWDGIKASGVTAIPAGYATTSFNAIDAILREKGIYIVPVGELEGFVKEVGGHGPEWVNKVLEQYPDLSSDVYTKVREFISSMKL